MQALGKLKRKSNIKVLDDVIPAVPRLLSEAMNIARVHIAKGCPVAVTMTVKGGVGATAALCLGWADTEGFRVVGVRGTLAAGLGVGKDMLVGRHAKEPIFKCMLGLPNACVDMAFKDVGEIKTDVQGPVDPGAAFKAKEV